MESSNNRNNNSSISSSSYPSPPQRPKYNKDVYSGPNVIKWDTQLPYHEREPMRVYYREALIMGFELKDMPQFLLSKSKRFVSMKYVYYLRDEIFRENRKWYFKLARDQTAYVSKYREVLDELKMLKKRIWRLLIDPAQDERLKLDASKELHMLLKTEMLLLRELPFITQLSKHYDPALMDPNNDDPFRMLEKPQESPSHHSRDMDLQHMTQGIYDGINTSIVKSAISRLRDKKAVYDNANKYIDMEDDPSIEFNKLKNRKVDSEIQAQLQGQLNILPQAEKIKDEIDLDRAKQKYGHEQIQALEHNIDEALAGRVDLEDVQQKYEEALIYLDMIVSPETKEQIKKMKKMLGSDNRQQQQQSQQHGT